MKRIFLIILALLLLTGCGAEDPNPTAAATEPQVDWLETYAMPWDKDGDLVELPVTIPGSIHYSAGMEYDGDLLLWSIDDHLVDSRTLELCLLDLDTGTVIAQRDVVMTDYISPQVIGDVLYLCDTGSGTVLELDKNLQETGHWDLEPGTGAWYMGANDTLYQMDTDYRLRALDLTTGEEKSVLPGDPAVMVNGLDGGTMTLQYYDDATGAQEWAAVDLLTGAVTEADIALGFDAVSIVGESWLSSRYDDGYVYQYSRSGEAPVSLSSADHYLRLLEDGKLLATSDDGIYLHLYDADGTAIASCQLSENGTYFALTLIHSEKYGGYFLMVSGYDGGCRVLYWDTTRKTDAEDLAFSEIPALSGDTLALKTRSEELSQKYGVQILVGEECSMDFDDFTASIVTDGERVHAALDVLDDAMSDYPEGFFRQLRHGSVRTVQIQLVSDLQANGNSGRTGDGYAAFTQEMWDHYLIVADIDDVTETSYYHEFSHVIDSCLEWDSWQREDALYSEDIWMSLNPDWFDGYSYDYGNLPWLEDMSWFVDSYSMVSPTEDRARVMEFAMYEYGSWTFDGAYGLRQKLSYYCRCIRDTFDTTGWPETVLWEQYLAE